MMHTNEKYERKKKWLEDFESKHLMRRMGLQKKYKLSTPKNNRWLSKKQMRSEQNL